MKNFQQKEVEGNHAMQAIKSALVSEYMVNATKLITFTPETGIMKVVETLLKNRIAGAPVLNDKNELVGLIDDKDCLKVLFDSAYHNRPVDNHTVAHYMSNVMKTISVHSDIYDVADIFLNSFYKRLLIVDDEGKLVGQISREDILRVIHDFNTNAR